MNSPGENVAGRGYVRTGDFDRMYYKPIGNNTAQAVFLGPIMLVIVIPFVWFFATAIFFDTAVLIFLAITLGPIAIWSLWTIRRWDRYFLNANDGTMGHIRPNFLVLKSTRVYPMQEVHLRKAERWEPSLCG